MYSEFARGQKVDCIKYCEANNLAFFQRDLNATFSKIFIAAQYEEIWAKICENGPDKSYYYESWSSSTPMKLFLDYDKKEITDDSQHKVDIHALIKEIFNKCLESGYNITNKNVWILKSIPDTNKKSYHIIFEGIHFLRSKHIQNWLEEQIKPKFEILFNKKIVDTKVYSPICIRTLHSTKCGQNRPLFLLDTKEFIDNLEEKVINVEDVSYKNFLGTCVTYIEMDSCLINYKNDKKKESLQKKSQLMVEDDIYSDKDIVKKYLDILDSSRYIERHKWLNVGYILSSINREYKDLWHYFSSKWEQYNEREADIAWDSFLKSEYIYTLNNLKYLARIDNIKEYEEISKEVPNHDIKYLRTFDNILSKLVYRLYGDSFVCSDCEKSIWYFFNGKRWIKENKSYNLRKLIINDVFEMIEKYRLQLIKENAEESIIRNYHNILNRLGNGIKLNCLELEFYNSNFDKILDQDKDLLGFENGVLDLKTMEFRDGTSSDYISMTTGYDFNKISQNDDEYIELMNLIYKIIPDYQTREYTLKSLASCLDGHNREENFYIWSGKSASGANGKSTILDLLLGTLGDYACISPVSLITGKRESSNSANSALASIRNKRCVVMQEPSATDQIKVDTMKSLTGNDRISTRENYGNQIEFKPCAKFIMACNKIPSVSDVDGGTIRRLKIIEFLSRFVDNPDPNNPYEFMIDRELKQRLENYKCAFMNILINYYEKYKLEGLNPPESVMSVIRKYERDNNIIKDFVTEKIVKGNSKDYITKEELKELFVKDATIKSYFGKFNNFIIQLENTLCTEFKNVRNKGMRIYGHFLKDYNFNQDNSEDEIDN